MVETDCLAHRCGDEPDLPTRLERAGYFDDAEAWQFAESTGCGAQRRGDGRQLDGDARFHRINILEQDFDDLGVGVVQEPVNERCDKGYATFAVVFGWRDAA